MKLFLVLVFIVSSVYALSLEEIKDQITKQGARWEATTATDQVLLWERPLIVVYDYDKPVGDLPNLVDWTPFASVVKNQGQCGSCVAFATIGLFEAQFNIWTGLPIYNFDMSEQHLFSCGGGKCSKGWDFKPAMDYITKVGISDELCMPYQASDASCSKVCKDPNRIIKVKSYKGVAFKNFKQTLASGKVILTGMAVYEDFMSYKSGIYQYVTGKLKGYHAVLLVGYKQDENYFIFKNSWKPSWGENGYFRIKADDKSLEFDGYTIDIR